MGSPAAANPSSDEFPSVISDGVFPISDYGSLFFPLILGVIAFEFLVF